MTTENNEQNLPENNELTDEQKAAAAAAALNQEPAKLPVSADGKPPVKEEKPVDKKDEGKVEPVVYDTSGDAGLDMLLEAAGNLGLKPDHPAMQAAIRGEFDLLALKLEEAEVKGGDKLIALGKKAYTEVITKTKEKQAADLKAVQEEVGGEQEWAAIQKWAGENADDAEKAEIRAALGKGGLAARMAAAWMASAYGRANGVSDDGTGLPVAPAAKGTPPSNGALSPKEYAKAVAAARVGFKGDFENSDTYKSLQARRMSWRP